MRIAVDAAAMPNAPPQNAKTSKLADAAQEFEASMLQELLKPMQNGQNSWGGEDEGKDNSFDTIRGFGTEAVAKAISKGGGFGIAKQVISQVTLEGEKNSRNSTSRD